MRFFLKLKRREENRRKIVLGFLKCVFFCFFLCVFIMGFFFFLLFLILLCRSKTTKQESDSFEKRKVSFEMIKLDTKRYLVIKFFFLGRVLGRSRSTFVNMLLQSVFFFFHPFTKGSFRRSDTHVIYINLHMHLRTICLIGIVVIFKVFF